MSEPVAWMLADKEKEYIRSIMAVQHDFVPQGCVEIPLYTHPVKELDKQFKKGFEAGKEQGWKAHKFHHPVKKLTDEEIYKIANGIEAIQHQHGLRLSNDLNVMDFARAILRKAQEK